MDNETYEVLAVEYARLDRPSREFYLFSPDPHEGPRTIAYYLWVVRNRARTVVVDLGFDRRSGEARGACLAARADGRARRGRRESRRR